ncbi:MAG: hypothetical protein ACYDD5_00070 [Sulfuricurvum sp.]
MGLSYNELYNISAGIFMAFTNKTDKRILTVNHPKSKRDNLEKIFPVSKYKDYTKENFIVTVLYVNFMKAPSSLIGCFEMLSNLEDKEALGFKNKIISYRKYLIDDIEKIKIEQGTNVSLDYMITEYRNNNINWYTFYFYLIASGQSIDDLEKSRLNGYLLKKIKKLLLYVTFSEKSILLIRELLQDSITIG